MTDQSPIDADLRFIPLDDLTLSDLNTRSEPPDAEINRLADSLAVAGLLQNLLGFDPGTGAIEIVAGGRRLRALQLLAGENWSRFSETTRTDPVPVRVTDDPLIAQAWASTENEARADLHPADQIKAYSDLSDKGLTIDAIARAFGQTTRHVRQRLALAALPDRALSALRSGTITLDLAKSMTTATSDPKRLDRIIDMATAEHPSKWEIDRALSDGRISSNDRRVKFVGLDTYKAEGGAITEDLFEDETLIHDEDLLDKLFHTALGIAADRIKADHGWQWVQPLGDAYLNYDFRQGMEYVPKTPVDLPQADLDEMDRLMDLLQNDALDDEGAAKLEELETRAEGAYTDADYETAGVFIYVDSSGALQTSQAYRKPEGSSTNADGTITKTEKKPAPPVAQAAIDDMARIETLSFQHALIDKPELVLDLLAFQLQTGRPPYASPLNVTATDAPTDTSADAGDSLIVDQRWADTQNAPSLDPNDDTAGAFETFRAEGKKHRNTILARHLACTFQRPSGETRALGQWLARELAITPRTHWTPDAEVYFKRCASGHLNDIYAELLELAEDDDRLTTFAKLKKGEKAKALHDLMHDASTREALGLSRDDNARLDAWLPHEMRDNFNA